MYDNLTDQQILDKIATLKSGIKSLTAEIDRRKEYEKLTCTACKTSIFVCEATLKQDKVYETSGHMGDWERSGDPYWVCPKCSTKWNLVDPKETRRYAKETVSNCIKSTFW